jgi:DNA replication protein DnaD
VSNGWIKLYRELLDKPIWRLSTPEQKSILITLLLLASHEPNEWEWKGEKFTVRSGQFVTSLESLAKKTGIGISIQNVRTCIHRFKKLGFLTNKSTKCGRLISIINWDSYQPDKKAPNKDGDKGVTKTQHMSNTYQECKNVKNEKKDPKTYCANFLFFWNAYPKKKSKASAEKAFLKLNPNKELREIILTKIEEAKKSDDWQKESGQYIPYPATWLNARGWEDEIKDISNVNQWDEVRKKYGN